MTRFARLRCTALGRMRFATMRPRRGCCMPLWRPMMRTGPKRRRREAERSTCSNCLGEVNRIRRGKLPGLPGLDAESLTTLGPSRIQDLAPTLAGHARAKAVGPFALNVAWLEGSLHVIRSSGWSLMGPTRAAQTPGKKGSAIVGVGCVTVNAPALATIRTIDWYIKKLLLLLVVAAFAVGSVRKRLSARAFFAVNWCGKYLCHAWVISA